MYYSAGNRISAALVGARVLLPRISVVDGMCDAGESKASAFKALHLFKTS